MPSGGSPLISVQPSDVSCHLVAVCGTPRWECDSTDVLIVYIRLLLLYDMDVSCHRPFLPGTSLEPAVIPTAQASSFTLQYFPYYV